MDVPRKLTRSSSFYNFGGCKTQSVELGYTREIYFKSSKTAIFQKSAVVCINGETSALFLELAGFLSGFFRLFNTPYFS